MSARVVHRDEHRRAGPPDDLLDRRLRVRGAQDDVIQRQLHAAKDKGDAARCRWKATMRARR
jgi:hypothetical protein